MPEVRKSRGHSDSAGQWTVSQPLSCVLVHIRREASGLISLQSKINPQPHLSPTALFIKGPGLYCPHLPLPLSMVERRGRVPSAHESGYCIIFCHRLTSSPSESISTSSFPIFTEPAGMNITHWMQNECRFCDHQWQTSFHSVNFSQLLTSLQMHLCFDNINYLNKKWT